MNEVLARKAANLLSDALKRAKSDGYSPRSKWAEKIKNVVCGGHVTFRYMMVTGILGKATNAAYHPRALQVNSELRGAYDARSLCHEVVVVFERESLENALGGSNEPFVNNPARKPEIAKENKVRAGADKAKLFDLFDTFEELNVAPSGEVLDALSDAMFFALERLESRNALLPVFSATEEDSSGILDFVDSFTSKSKGGETCALATGAVMAGLIKIFKDDLRMIVHPVNQSGSSSNEISDIDVYNGDKLLYAIEVKDKDFTEADVQHAARKISEAGHDKLLFVVGPASKTPSETEQRKMEKLLYNGNVSVTFVSMGSFVRNTLYLSGESDPSSFYETIKNLCVTIRAQDGTFERLAECAEEVGWISEEC